MKKYILLIMYLYIHSLLLNAEDTKLYQSYLLSYPSTVLSMAKAPSLWEKKEWLMFSSAVLIGTALYLEDENIDRMIVRNRNETTEQIADVGNVFGNGKIMLPIIAGTGLVGYLTNSKKTEETALLCIKSAVIAGGITSGIKIITQRKRPYMRQGNQFWRNSPKFNKGSFPSGHVTLIFSIVPIISNRLEDYPYVTPLLYGMALSTCYSRLHGQNHWSSDVFAGAITGYLTAKCVLKTTPDFNISYSDEIKGPLISYYF